MHYFYSYKPNADTVFLYGSLHTDEPLITAGLPSSSTFGAQQDNDPHDPLTGDMMSFGRWLEEVSAFAESSEMNPGYHPEPVPLLTSGLPAGWPEFSTTLTTGTVPIEEDPILYDSNGVLDHGASPSNFHGDLLPFMPTPNPIAPTESSQGVSGYTLSELPADGDWLFGPLELANNPTEVLLPQPMTPATETSEDDPRLPVSRGSRSSLCVTYSDAQQQNPQQRKRPCPQGLPSPSPTLPPPSYCESCNKPFRRHADYRRHLRTAKPHQGSTSKHVCPSCGHGFTRTDSLIRHGPTQCSKKRKTGRSHGTQGGH